jgi:hypothetical protein
VTRALRRPGYVLPLALVIIGAPLVACGGDSPATSEGNSTTSSSSTVARPAIYPMQQWMKANATPAMADGDSLALRRVFLRIGAFAPPEFPTWMEMTTAGSQAAERGDLEACRRSCTLCHERYREAYRSSLRGRALPSASNLRSP